MLLELRDVLVLVEDRLVSGTEVEGVADVLVRENIGRCHVPLQVLLLVRVQRGPVAVAVDDDHERRGGHGSAAGTPGVAGATVAAGLPCGMQFGGGRVMA